jgi:PAS domain S-box-containing protein
MEQPEKYSFLNVLCLEDSPADAELIRKRLESSGYKLMFRLVANREEFEIALRDNMADLILSDYRLPSYDGMEALKFVTENYPDIPFICISGTIGEELAVEMMKMGAADYVLKDKLYKLVPAVKRALKETKERKELARAGTELKKLSRAVEQSPAGVIISDTKGNIEYVNQKFVEITGYTPERVSGKKVRILRNDPLSKADPRQIWETISTGAIWKGEFSSKRSSGEKYWEYVIISSIRNAEGEIANYIIIIEDITERKQMVLDLEEAKTKAEENDKLKTAFLNNMSHEIRTPMNGLLGFAELLDMPGIGQDQITEYVSYIRNSGQRLLELIDEVFEISMIESGQEYVSLTPTDINLVLSEEMQKFVKAAEIKQLILTYIPALNGNSSIITTDVLKFRKIVNNLLDNAIKFTMTGGIELGYNLQEGFLHFFVSDTGVGIPSELCDKVFEPFRQADMSVSRSFQGAGLGLAIAKAFVVLLGGRIWIDSDQGRGTIVFFTLPYIKAGDMIR